MTDATTPSEGSTPAPGPTPAPQAPASSATPKVEDAAAENTAAKAEGFVSRKWGKVKDNFKYVEGNKGMVFARGAGVAAGIGMTLHSLKSQNAAGEDRSTALRMAEGVLGLGLTVASAHAGGR